MDSRVERLLFTVDELAEALGVAPITIRRAAWAGELEVVRIGKAIRFRKNAIDSYLSKHTVIASKNEATPSAVIA